MIKIAVNTGEVHITNKDVYGEAVNIASRLEKVTKPGKIFFTESVFLSMNKNEVSIGFAGEKMFKGVPHKVKFYTITEKYDQVIMNLKRKKRKIVKKINKLLLFFLAILIFGAIAGAIIFFVLYQNQLF